jgi:hypothetical protein
MAISNPTATRVAFLAVALALSLANLADAQSKVAVVNQPSVSVPSPIPHTHLEEFEAIPVSPGCPTAVPLKLDAEGYSHAMLSLAVEVQGASPSSGMVTASLVPDVPFVVRAYEDDKVELFPIWTAVTVHESESSFFGSQPVRHPLSFPKYRVYFNNSCDRPVKAYLYVNLTH